jgi:hypothetical protein
MKEGLINNQQTKALSLNPFYHFCRREITSGKGGI